MALAVLGLALSAAPVEAACNLGLLADMPVTRAGGDSITEVKINGLDARLIVDTGDFFNMIAPSSATRLKMTTTAQEYDVRGVGVGGETGRLGLQLARTLTLMGVVNLHNIDFLLGQRDFGEADGLLGENILAFPEIEFDLAHDDIKFFKPIGCVNESLAYWATSRPYSVIDIQTKENRDAVIEGYALVNGVKIKVQFDTGAPSSMMTVAAAAKAGVRPFGPGVYPAGRTSGIAKNSDIQIWNAPFASFQLGDEEIKNVRIFIGPLGIGETSDMLLGADFFRSHHIMVSNTQGKLYFTSNGGIVFNASLPREAPGSEAAASDKPTDASGLQQRAKANFVRRDFDAAIADLTQAMALAPTNADYVYERGDAYWLEHKPQLAMADFDQSLKLKPDNIGVLLARSSLHRANKEFAEATVDLHAADGFAAHDARWGLALGQAYSLDGDHEKSLQWLDQWIAAKPDDARMSEALSARCWSRALLGRELSKALADCNASLKLLPGDPTTLDSRGLVRLRLGDFDGSIADYNAAIAAHPDVAWSYYGRALAEENKGMISEGEDDERKAKKLSPDIAATAAKAGVVRPSL
jgi:tetratricopeptide (TPR) repeat protein/predicted aspartyl protease